jgi:hypothetical protein
MDAAKLLLRLMEIERAMEKHETPGVRSMLIDAQNLALQLYRDRLEILNENVRLRADALAVLVRVDDPVATIDC